jgi:aminomethyltransferase
MIADYGEWELPARFVPIEKEHYAALNAVALFDNSAAGKFSVHGSDSEDFIRRLLPTPIDRCGEGSFMRSCLCDEQGAIIDMIGLYRPSENEFIISGSFASADRDFRWMNARRSGDVSIENVSENIAKIDCIGPMSPYLVSDILGLRVIEKTEIGSVFQAMYRNRPCFAAKTDFAGIPLCEIFIHGASASKLWEEMISVGRHYGIVPAGMDAANLISLERAWPVQNHELREHLTPVEANLPFLTGSKDDYPGKKIIESQLANGAERSLVLVSCRGKGTVHAEIPLFRGNDEAGTVIRSGRYAGTKDIIATAIMKRTLADPKMTYYVGKPGSQMVCSIITPGALAEAS